MGVTGLPARALVALGVAAAGTWLAGLVARRIGLLDRPGPRKPHPAPVPLSGGVGLALGATAGLLGTDAGPPILGGLWVLVAVGLVDDFRGLRARTRLVAQGVAALPAVLVYAPATGPSRFLEVGLALVWAVAVITAVKCLDCADGVAAGTAIVGALALGTLGGWAGSPAPVAVALAGSAGGFLAFNAPPARAFLGEGGSTGLGFLLAAMALMVAGNGPTGGAVPLGIAVVTVLMLPVLDFTVVHARRFRAGVRKPADLMASTGTDHVPHRLAAAGLGPPWVAAVCAVAVAVSGLAARVALEGGPAGSLVGAVAVAAGFGVGEWGLSRRRVAQRRPCPRRPGAEADGREARPWEDRPGLPRPTLDQAARGEGSEPEVLRVAVAEPRALDDLERVRDPLGGPVGGPGVEAGNSSRRHHPSEPGEVADPRAPDLVAPFEPAEDGGAGPRMRDGRSPPLDGTSSPVGRLGERSSAPGYREMGAPGHRLPPYSPSTRYGSGLDRRRR